MPTVQRLTIRNPQPAAAPRENDRERTVRLVESRYNKLDYALEQFAKLGEQRSRYDLTDDDIAEIEQSLSSGVERVIEAFRKGKRTSGLQLKKTG